MGKKLKVYPPRVQRNGMKLYIHRFVLFYLKEHTVITNLTFLFSQMCPAQELGESHCMKNKPTPFTQTNCFVSTLSLV